MVRNLAIITCILISILGGMLIYDYFQIPSKNLIIIYTSNLRGQIKPFEGTVEGRQYNQVGGLAFIKGFIKKMSQPFSYKPEEVLLLDTGDAIFGTAEATLTMGEMPLRLMSKAGYDAMAIGNMEFEFGFEALKNFAQSNIIPMLACNYRDVSSPIGNTFKPGIIVEKSGVKIGVIGLGQNDIARNTRQDNIINLEVTDMVNSVQNTASLLKEKGAEIIVLLSHEPTIGNNPNLPKMFPDVDIVIGDLIGPASTNFGQKPLVCQTAPGRGAGVGIIKIVYQSGKWQVEQGLHRILAIDSSAVEPDAELSQEISKFESKIDNLLDEVVTTSKGQFNHSYLEESTIGALIADSMKEATGADVALTNSGGIKSVIYEGQVTLRNLYEILPFENNLITVELPGNELETLIEQSLCDSKSGFLQSSGITCLYSTINPGGCRIIQLDINDKPIEFNSTYTVAINDFMYANTMDWPELSAGKNPKIRGMIRESFKDYLKKRSSISPNSVSQYKESDDDVVTRFPLTTELVTLSTPVTQDVKTHYEYSTLVCEMIRKETQSDFALMPASLVRRTREPLQVVTMSKVLSDFSSKEGVSVVEMTGKMINTVLADSFKAQNNISFAGFSIEKTDNSFKIYPWNDSFEEDTLYKVAVNEGFVDQLNNITHSNLKKNKRFSDIRRTFIDGLRKVDGKVELKRVFY